MLTASIDPNKVAVYIRWSTEEQGQGTTLEVQKESCEHFVKSQGWTFREDLMFVDEGFSGGSMERPGITQLREAVKAGLVDCVVVYKLDRLSRSVVDTVNLVLKDWEGKCFVKSAREPIDTTNAAGKMFFYMLVSYAEFERSTIKERTLSGKRKRAEQGRNAGHRYGYGYRKAPGGKWELDGWDQENRCFTGPAAIVRRIFDEYLSGKGTPEIAEVMRDEGIPAPGRGIWRFSSIYAMLNNPAYAGIYTYGKRYGARKWTSVAPKYIVDDAIPPIITKEEWARVQALMQTRAARPPRTLRSDYLLSGIARCAKCGAGLCGSRRTKGNSVKRYYVCANDILLGCDNATIDADRLEQDILKEVKTEFSIDRLAAQVEAIEAELRQRVAECTHRVTSLEAESAATERREQKLTDDYFANKIDETVFNRLLPKVMAELARSQEQLQEARLDLAEAQAARVSVDQLTALAAKVDVLDDMSIAELKEFLRSVIASLIVWQDRKPKGKGSPRDNKHPLVVRVAFNTDSLQASDLT